MNGKTVLVSPLNWGYGHAGRMIPVALELKRRGCDVIFAADVSLLEMAGRELPGIRLVAIPGLRIRYSRNLPQYICIFLQLPRIIASAITEHRVLRQLVRELNPSLIISDNRFGFYHRKVYSVYVTHQLRIPFPGLLRFMEPLAAWLHRMIISRYDLCLVPDFPGDENLSGRLSHGVRLPQNMMYMGPLSRFAAADGGEIFASDPAAGSEISVSSTAAGSEISVAGVVADGEIPLSSTASGTGDSTMLPDEEEAAGSSGNPYVCLILSGPEPQRTILLEKAAEALRGIETVIFSAGPPPPGFTERYPSATLSTAPARETMHRIIASSSLVIARAGYTSVMELFMMGRGAVIIPTPGQPEQEYIAMHLNNKYGFITIKQDKLELLPEIVKDMAHFAGNAEIFAVTTGELAGSAGFAQGTSDLTHRAAAGADADSSFAEALFRKAIECLLEQKKK